MTKETKKVKIKFNKMIRNKNISNDDYNKFYNEYLEEVKQEHGRKMAFPQEQATVMRLLEQKIGQPYVFNMGIVYELDEEDAKHYTSMVEKIIDPELGPFYFKDVARDRHRYMVDFHIAELVK
jgi:hypothetical protein